MIIEVIEGLVRCDKNGDSGMDSKEVVVFHIKNGDRLVLSVLDKSWG